MPVAAALADAAARGAGGIPSGWRNLPSQPQIKRYRDADGTEYEVRYAFTRDGLRIEGRPGLRLVSSSPSAVVFEDEGVRRTYHVSIYEDDSAVYVDAHGTSVALTPISRFPDAADAVEPGSLLAPMPGAVARIAVGEGDAVAKGQPLLWLEAMKMEHLVAAPTDGVLARLHVTLGQQVGVGAVLALVEPHSGTDAKEHHP